MNCLANMCFCYLACHPLNHHEFSKRGKCNPLLWKNVITVTAVNGSSNCAISLQKDPSLPKNMKPPDAAALRGVKLLIDDSSDS